MESCTLLKPIPPSIALQIDSGVVIGTELPLGAVLGGAGANPLLGGPEQVLSESGLWPGTLRPDVGFALA